MHQLTKQKHAVTHFICHAFIGMVLLTAIFGILTPAAFAASHTLPPLLIKTVCKNTSIQPGWVIVDVLTDQHRCKGGLLNPGNVWAITKATGPTNVCTNSPIPQGFVVTTESDGAEDTASRHPCGHANLCGLSTAQRVSYCTAHHHACGLPYRSRIILADRASSCLTLECLKKELREPLTLASYRGILVPGSTWCPIVLPVPNCSSIVHQGRLVAHANEASNASENKPRNRKRK